MLVAVNGKGNICGVRQEGVQEIEFRRLPELLEVRVCTISLFRS